MNTEPRVGVSFKGCRTRTGALALLDAWLDESEAEMVRAFASRLLLNENNPKEIESQIVQLRGYLAATRADVRARFTAILDEAASRSFD